MTDDGWKPIETAPEGKALLLYQPALYHPRQPNLCTHPALMRVGYLHDWPNRKPTHWRPLPAPPGEG